MEFFNYLGGLINENPGKTLGSLVGLVLGILMFTIGFVKTLLIVLLVFVGFLVGKSRDDDVSLPEALMSLFTRRKDRE
jgi:uncharacterized membrane protein